MYCKNICFPLFRLSRIYYYCKRTSVFDVLAKMSKPKTQDFKLTATPSNVYLQVIGSGARGAASSLYLFTDYNRYLFNCGEATQRVALEHKIKVSRLSHIFVTNNTWKNLGGLPGLTITLQQVGMTDIVLHGPDGLGSLYNATKGFVVLKDLSVHLAKCTSSEQYVDNALSIKYVSLYPDNVVKEDVPGAKRLKLDSPSSALNYNQFINDKTDYYNRSERKRKTPSPPLNLDSCSPNNLNGKDPNKCSIAYICTLKSRLGTLQLDKCVEYGVKPGPLLGKLKNGEDVTLPDGTVVLSKDVKTPDDPGPVFIVIEIPDLSYLKESEFSEHFDNGTNPAEKLPVLVVHFTPSEVLCTSRYREFMSKFGPLTQHLFMNELNNCLGSEAVHRIQHKLHLLDPQVFPLLRDVSIPPLCEADSGLKDASPVLLQGIDKLKNKFESIVNLENVCQSKLNSIFDGLNVIEGRTLTTFHLRPSRPLDRSLEPKLNFQENIQEITNVDEFFQSLDKYKTTREGLRKNLYPEYPQVLFLGTGSSMPGKTRNVSSIAVYTAENRTILLDCGEGTHSQIIRLFGQRTNQFLINLRAVYISHLHADHHLGLFGVLQARRRAFEESQLPPEPLYLISPGQIMTWLSIYHKQFEPVLDDIQLVPNQYLIDGPEKLRAEVPHLTPPMLINMGIKDIRTCLVSHCPSAYGVSLYVDDYKITYSGDTIPCQELIDLGKDSTLLIHEATMEDELEKDARYKMHSTMSQAIDVGRRMNAKHTILTHFSQRYARIPRFNDDAKNNYLNIGIAYDNMQVTLNDLDILPHMFAPLHIIFAEHCLVLDMKAALRQKQSERLSSIRSAKMPTSSPIDDININKL